MTASLVGVLLAGGKSMRMGCDKALCEIGGVRLVDRVVARLRVQTERILISGPEDYETGFERIADDAAGPTGPFAGVLAAARRLRGEAKGFLTAPVDAPFLAEDLAARLVSPTSAIAAAAGALHPTFAWWIVDDVLNAADRLLDSRDFSLRRLAEAAGAKVVSWADDAPFANINTPADLQAARRRCSQPTDEQC